MPTKLIQFYWESIDDAVDWAGPKGSKGHIDLNQNGEAVFRTLWGTGYDSTLLQFAFYNRGGQIGGKFYVYTKRLTAGAGNNDWVQSSNSGWTYVNFGDLDPNDRNDFPPGKCNRAIENPYNGLFLGRLRWDWQADFTDSSTVVKAWLFKRYDPVRTYNDDGCTERIDRKVNRVMGGTGGVAKIGSDLECPANWVGGC